jgi:hypothetical protein
MPVYDFRNKDTGEVITLTMKISEKEEYLKSNPNIESYFGDTQMNIGDPVRLGVRKIDGGFKDVLARVADRTPGGKALKGNSSQNF